MYYNDGRMKPAKDGGLRLEDPTIEIPLTELFDEE